jgi:hypothetical protein
MNIFKVHVPLFVSAEKGKMLTETYYKSNMVRPVLTYSKPHHAYCIQSNTASLFP